MIHPRVQFLEGQTIKRIIDEAYQLLMDPGVIFATDKPLRLLADTGAEVDFGKKLAIVRMDKNGSLTNEQINKALQGQDKRFTGSIVD